MIDGTSEPNYKGLPLIQLDGSALGPGTDGLVISAGQSTVKGLAIVGFSGSAIVVKLRPGEMSFKRTTWELTPEGRRAPMERASRSARRRPTRSVDPLAWAT